MSNHQKVAASIESEISRFVGNRLLSWAMIGLMTTTILVVFRLFYTYPEVIDQWLLWISPLMLLRAGAGWQIQRWKFGLDLSAMPLSRNRRMAVLFGVSDGLLLLTANMIFGAAGIVDASVLLMANVAVLAFLTFVYLYTPVALLSAILVAVAPSLVLAKFHREAIPVQMLATSFFILAGTLYGALTLSRVLYKQLWDKFSYAEAVDEAAESNYIFNEQWQKTPLAAIDWDCDFKIRSWNPSAQRRYGYTEAEAVGRSLELLFDSAEADKIRQKWLRMLEGGQAESSVHAIDDKSGHRHYTEWHDSTITHEGEVIGFASLVNEITLRVDKEAAPDGVVDLDLSATPRQSRGCTA